MSEIMITLQQIRDQPPCDDGWKKVYKANRGDMTKSFPLKSILDSNDLNYCLWALRCLPEHDNLWRLYAVWCARQVEHLMTDARSKAALDVAERFAVGDATQEELTDAVSAARDASAAACDSCDSYDSCDASIATCAAELDAAIAAKAACDASSDMLAVRAAARATAWAASAASSAGSVWSVVRAAASDAQKAKLIEILTVGEWV